MSDPVPGCAMDSEAEATGRVINVNKKYSI